MEIIAKLNNLRMSARKVRLVADMIRNKSVLKAKTDLMFSPRLGAKAFAKLLDSAIANAKNNFQLDENDLYISKAFVDDGRKLKRWRPRSRGRAFPIQKKTSHLTIVLSEKEGKAGKIKKTAPEKKSEIKPLETKTKEKGFAAKTRKERFDKEGTEVALKQKSAGQGLKRIFRRKAF